MYRRLDPGSPETFPEPRELDVLVPTRNRPAELAATLAGLAAQDVGFGVVISDQSDRAAAWEHGAVAGTVRVLRHRGHPVLLCRHLPRRGMAEQRAFLLDRSRARYVLFLDDDVWLEPDAVARMLTAIKELRCGFVGNFPHGLSYVDDHRLEQEKTYQEWAGRPEPERIVPRGPQWRRATLHSAANLLHLTERLNLAPGQWRAYRVAWLGACVLYDRTALIDAGGYDFWPRVPPEHSGEDVAAQLRVLARTGGAGIVPSGAYHLETPTTVPDRRMECFDESLLADELRSGRPDGECLDGAAPVTSPDHAIAALPDGLGLDAVALAEGQEFQGSVDDLLDRDVADERG
jgi:GT2 family glycosyltransferase